MARGLSFTEITATLDPQNSQGQRTDPASSARTAAGTMAKISTTDETVMPLTAIWSGEQDF